MSRDLHIAVVGAGFAGQGHAFGFRNAQMLPALEGVNVIMDTLVEPSTALAESVAARYGFARTASCVEEILERPEIEAVSLALPNNAYIGVVPRLLEAGKHVFCEKPLGLSTAEAREMTRAAQEAGVVTSVGFCRRRVPALAALAQVVAEGGIGTVHSFRASYFADYAADPQAPRTWRFQRDIAGGGAVADIGAHIIDTVRFLLGEVAEVTSATLETVITERPLPTGGTGHNQGASLTETGAVENDDNAVVSLRMNSGAVGSVNLSRIATGITDVFAIEVYGSKGWAKFESPHSDELYLCQPEQSAPGFDGPRQIIAGPAFPYFSDVACMPGRGVGTGYGENLVGEIQEFVAAVVGRGEVTVPFAEAIPTMAIIEAAEESARTRTPVTPR
ncbi:gfo/Idh/MocA family oxidoreductase [Actinomyces sp. 2119]|uniref:Gfo/Idh/MocA family oxidoreductase n=1 Tax=Actinomyces lilanjuaniae TaxID=2321394 RepID=A0ABN5PQT2_9ACTO|nr:MULTISPECIES: Gfo/Idh/MocA family oxidoreductase [Actinomyces]AYD89404.1 gfo/Idh/MocA family oxidoreductase [Actinomyces lilanjuaniae]RJF43237.1 gfo/Idh/MocA family oxidoreductase [Actinomyces sp. 2119]